MIHPKHLSCQAPAELTYDNRIKDKGFTPNNTTPLRSLELKGNKGNKNNCFLKDKGPAYARSSREPAESSYVPKDHDIRVYDERSQLIADNHILRWWVWERGVHPGYLYRAMCRLGNDRVIEECRRVRLMNGLRKPAVYLHVCLKSMV